MHNLRLSMIRNTIGRELRALNAINRLGLSMPLKTLDRELKALDTMNSAMDDMGHSRLWDQSSRCYKVLKVMDEMNDSGSHELKPLDVMNYLGSWMIWMILCHELKPLDDMNC